MEDVAEEDFGDRRGVYVTETVEDKQTNDTISAPELEPDPARVSEQPQPAWLQNENEEESSENE